MMDFYDYKVKFIADSKENEFDYRSYPIRDAVITP